MTLPGSLVAPGPEEEPAVAGSGEGSGDVSGEQGEFVPSDPPFQETGAAAEETAVSQRAVGDDPAPDEFQYDLRDDDLRDDDLRDDDLRDEAPLDGPAPGDGEGPRLGAALEAILMVVDVPVSEVTLAQVLERPTHEVSAALHALAAEYTGAGRGFDLRKVAGGWRYYTRADCAPLVERFVRDGQQTRLTQAALETLAVVAYRQPVSRARVAAVRGVNSDGVMRTLVARGLVEEAGTDPESQAVLYRTSSYFLERLGLNDISELPELAPFLPDDVENLEETTK
jgi:segregation and condensation protein B